MSVSTADKHMGARQCAFAGYAFEGLTGLISSSGRLGMAIGSLVCAPELVHWELGWAQLPSLINLKGSKEVRLAQCTQAAATLGLQKQQPHLSHRRYHCLGTAS